MTVQSKPFINHFVNAFIDPREGIDKGLKAGKNAASLIQWALPLAAPESATARTTADMAGRAAHQMGFVRSAVKLVDVFDSLQVPEGALTGAQLGALVVERVGYGMSDSISALMFGHDVSLYDLGEAASTIAQVGDACAAVALTTTVTNDVIKHNELSVAIDAENAELTRVNELIASQQQGEVDDEELVGMRERVEARLEYLHANREKVDLDLAQKIFDIAAIVFGFMVTLLSIPLLIATPILCTLGFTSAGTALVKMWVKTSSVMEQNPPPASTAVERESDVESSSEGEGVALEQMVLEGDNAGAGA